MASSSGHHLEHAAQAVEGGQGDQGAAVRPRLDQAGGGQLADRLAHRGAGNAEAGGDLHLFQGCAGGQAALDDFIGNHQAQFFAPRRLAAGPGSGGGRLGALGRGNGRQGTILKWAGN